MSESRTSRPVAAEQIVGGREVQEDALDVRCVPGGDGREAWLLVLADGMGGHAGGAAASRLAVDTFVDACIGGISDIPSALQAGLDRANRRIADEISARPAFGDMGTTLVGVVISNSHLYWISVGDSPLWLYRDGQLQRLNADHSMVPVLEGLVEIGRMSEQEAAVDPRRNQLRSAVSGGEFPLVDFCPGPQALRAGDLVVLASDGVETLSQAQLAAILGDGGRSLQQRVRSVMDAIEAAGRPRQDNASLIVLEVS